MDAERCKGCGFYDSTVGCCDYYLFTGIRRPRCEGDCPGKTTLTRREIAKALFRMNSRAALGDFTPATGPEELRVMREIARSAARSTPRKHTRATDDDFNPVWDNAISALEDA